MALIKGRMVKGITPCKTSGMAGDVVHNRITHTFPEAATNGDILELCLLPQFHYLVSFHVITALTVGAIGIMSGTPDDADAGRTLGTAIVTGVDINDFGRLVAATGTLRSIGVTIGQNVAIAGGQIDIGYAIVQG